MNINWLINRLKVMSIGEVFYRLKNLIIFKIVKIKAYKKEKNSSTNDSKLILNIFLEDSLFDKTINSQQILKFAENTINNRIKVFGTDIQLSKKFDWSTDPINRGVWLDDYFMDIDYRNSDCPGDPKIIWEINRQQWLVNLGIAYSVTNEEKYAEKAVFDILSWIESNPKHMGINWVSALESAIRIISWTFTLNLIKNNSKMTDSINHIIANSIYEQADFINNYLSLYSSANNHLIGELTGLLYASYVLVESKETIKWRNKAINLLERQITNQFFVDGVNKEQSIYYQCYTMEYYFLCSYILKKDGLMFKKSVINMIYKACEFINDMSDEKGQYSNIGDEDGGYGLKIDENENKVLSILSLGSMVLNKNHLVNKDRYFDYKSYLLYGSEYLDFYNSFQKEENLFYDKIKSYPMGGYGIIKKTIHKENRLFINFDFGPIGLKPISAHGHADILSISLLYNNIPFIIDPGTYKYYFAEDWRSYFKSTAAHNTLSVNNDSQLKDLGLFLWGTHPKIKHSNNYSDSSGMWAEHDGYKKTYGVIHRRSIEIDNDIISIIDYIKTNRKNKIKQYYHLHPEVKVELIDKNIYKITNNAFSIYMKIDISLKSVLINGQAEPYKMGWVSTEFYKIQASNAIENSSTIDSDTKYVTKISFKKENLCVE